jgi:CheY-like chemotaxis protein
MTPFSCLITPSKRSRFKPCSDRELRRDAIAYLSGTGRYSDWKQFPLPSIVLLDLKLPGLDGLGVLRWIRQQPGLKALRVAMLTSSELGQESNAAYEAGANVFLTKPVDLNKLVEMMRPFECTGWNSPKLPRFGASFTPSEQRLSRVCRTRRQRPLPGPHAAASAGCATIFACRSFSAFSRTALATSGVIGKKPLTEQRSCR